MWISFGFSSLFLWAFGLFFSQPHTVLIILLQIPEYSLKKAFYLFLFHLLDCLTILWSFVILNKFLNKIINFHLENCEFIYFICSICHLVFEGRRCGTQINTPCSQPGVWHTNIISAPHSFNLESHTPTPRNSQIVRLLCKTLYRLLFLYFISSHSICQE